MEYSIKKWEGEELGRNISIDTETTVAPFHTRNHELVTCQAYDGKGIVYFVDRADIGDFFERHTGRQMIMQNAPFDVEVLAKYTGWNYWFNAYDGERVWDTKILYILYKLACTGEAARKSSLKVICKELLNIDLDKESDTRTTFEQFLNVPLSEIPEKYLKYAAEDAVYTLDVYFKLRGLIREYDKYNTVLTHHTQVKGALALDAIYKNGLGFDLERAGARLAEIEEEMRNIQLRLATWGYVQGRPGVTDHYEQIMGFLGLADKLPKSEKTGRISQKSDDLSKYVHIPFIKDYLRHEELHKLSTFIKNIEEPIVHGRFNPILNTGRVSQSKPNIQQLPRSGGIRECFIPKTPGNVFVDADYSAIELVALSEITYRLFGYSEMRDLINEGEDLHKATASSIYKKAPSEVTKDERQFAKIPNFAYPTNMAPKTFVQYCKPMGINLDEKEASKVKKAWLERYPEIEEYFSYPRRFVDGVNDWGKDTYYNYTVTGRRRARCSYTEFLNTHFQGLAADGCKLALYRCLKEGLHMVLVMHDQIMVEASREDADSVRESLEKCMIEGMCEVITSTKVTVESQITERFTK